jgi:hypothetical protein
VGDPFKPTSYKIVHDNAHAIIIEIVVIKPAPFSPIFLPNSPDIKALNKGINITNKYIFKLFLGDI